MNPVGTFWYRIDFAVYTKVDESEIKTPRFGHVSEDFESGILRLGFKGLGHPI